MRLASLISGVARENARPRASLRSARGTRPGYRPSFELLEGRLAPATITVLGTGDATGSLTTVSAGAFTAPTLRAAIDGANQMGGANTINFRSAVAGTTIMAVA